MTPVGIAALFVIGLLGARFAGHRVGLVAAAIAAAYPNLWISDSLVMSESLAVLIVAASLVVALDFHRRPGIGRAIGLGVLAGLGALTRSEIALFAVGFAALAWGRAGGHPRRALMPVLVLAATAATVAPWALYNLARFEKPVLLSTNGEKVLLGANCDSTYYDDVGGWDIRCLSTVPGVEGLDASVGASRRREIALEYVSDHLDRVPVVVAARVGRLLDVYGLDSLVAFDVAEEKVRWAVWTGIAAWWVLGPLALLGWVAAGRGGDRHDRRAARWWLVMPLGTVLITTVLFYGAHRIRAPAEPAIVLLAATGIVAVVDRVRRRGSAGSFGLVGAGDAAARPGRAAGSERARDGAARRSPQRRGHRLDDCGNSGAGWRPLPGRRRTLRASR
jgi:hypothetical protein